MEEAKARHIKAMHYSASAETQVGREARGRDVKDLEFWSTVLGSLSHVKLKKEEAVQVVTRVWEVTEWNDPMEEKTRLVEVSYQN